MFGIFKKKPLEEKYGRDNYLADPQSFVENDHNWILMLSAVLVEATDLELWGKRARHDLLQIYEEGALDESEQKELKEVLKLKKAKHLKKRVKNITELVSRQFEDDVYYAVNYKTLKEALKKAKKTYGDDGEKQELYEKLWNNRDTYKNVHMRMGIITDSILQVRLACYFNIIDDNKAWQYLEKLADLARPLMTIFSSWEGFNENIRLFNEIYDYEYYHTVKYVERAVICLNLRKESPLKHIAYDLGVDKSYPYNVLSHTNILPPRIKSGQGALRKEIKSLFKNEDLTPLWKKLDQLENNERHEEFTYIQRKLAKTLEEEEILELPELFPNVYAYATRSDYFYNMAWVARGHGTSNTVGEDNYKLFYKRLELSLTDSLKAHELDPMSKVVWVDLYHILSHFHDENTANKKEEIYQLIVKHGLSNHRCVCAVANYKQERWGGSYEEGLDWARQVIAGTERGDPVRTIIFEFAIERYDYHEAFGDNNKNIKALLSDESLKSELNQYCDELLENINAAPYRIVDVLCFWYSITGDYHRLRKVVNTMEVGKFELTAMNNSYKKKYVPIIMNWFRSV